MVLTMIPCPVTWAALVIRCKYLGAGWVMTERTTWRMWSMTPQKKKIKQSQNALQAKWLTRTHR